MATIQRLFGAALCLGVILCSGAFAREVSAGCQFAGRAPGFVGVDQVNFLVPFLPIGFSQFAAAAQQNQHRIFLPAVIPGRRVNI